MAYCTRRRVVSRKETFSFGESSLCFRECHLCCSVHAHVGSAVSGPVNRSACPHRLSVHVQCCGGSVTWDNT